MRTTCEHTTFSALRVALVPPIVFAEFVYMIILIVGFDKAPALFVCKLCVFKALDNKIN